MRKTLLLIPLLTALAAPAWAGTQTYFGFSIGVTNAPPPPRMVVVQEDPHLYYVSENRVYVVDDDRNEYDQFRAGAYWYVCNDGYWYRAPKYRGPYRAIDVRRVPRRVLNVPASHWRHRSHDSGDRRYVIGEGKHDHKQSKDKHRDHQARNEN